MRVDCRLAWMSFACLLVAAGCRGKAEEEAAKPLLPAEQWEVMYLGGERMGYGETTCEEVEIEGQRLVRIRAEQVMHVLRYGQQMRMTMKIESLETPSGELVSFQSMSQAPGTQIAAQGKVEVIGESRKLTITAGEGGAGQQFLVGWAKEYRGPFGIYQVLIEDPLEPGEAREFTGLVQVINQPAQYELQAVDYETTELLEGEAELLRVNVQFTLPGQSAMAMTLWTDQEGKVVKQHMAGVDQAVYTVSREVALAEQAPPEFDLGKMSVVRLAEELPAPHRQRQIVYRARLPEGNPAEVFPTGESQAVQAIDEHTAEISVRALRGGVGAAGDGEAEGFVPTAPAGDDDLAPNGMIESDDPAVVALANSFAAGEEDPWQLALALERGVNSSISAKNFSQAFATAAEVAQNREGDCSEHAVLLAALCRARGIPARVATGLVYADSLEGFGLHMWTEVWIDGRWIPLDATLGIGGIGAGHIKLSETNLAGSDAMSAFMPVLQVMRQLELEVVGAQ